MAQIKAFLFDLDGVLVDAADWHKEAFNKALEHFGYPPLGEEEHVQEFNGLSTKRKLEILASQYRFDIGFANEFNRQKQKYTLELIEERCRPINRIKEVLDFCRWFTGYSALRKSGAKLAVVTNCSRFTCEFMMVRSEIWDYFEEVIITNDDVRGKIKPHPMPYLMAQNRLGVFGKNCLGIDDTDKGIMSVVDAGCRPWRLERFEDLTQNNIERQLINAEYSI